MIIVIVFEIFSYITSLIAIILNTVLLYLSIFKSPSSIKSYSILIMNFAITDIFATLSSLSVIARQVPIGPKTVQISYGFCRIFGPTVCFVGCALMFHFFVYSQYSLLLSFSYRLYVLKRPAPKIKFILLLISIAYIPAFFHLFFTLFNQADTKAAYAIYQTVYPDDVVFLDQVTGNLNTEGFSANFPRFNMLLCPFPVIISVVMVRRQIIKLLEKTMEHLSKETKVLHKQLLYALTFQAVLPIFFAIGIVVFNLEAAGIVRNFACESLISASECFIPVMSPILYLYYVTPYRRALLRLSGSKLYPEETTRRHSSTIHEKKITTVA